LAEVYLYQDDDGMFAVSSPNRESAIKEQIKY